MVQLEEAHSIHQDLDAKTEELEALRLRCQKMEEEKSAGFGETEERIVSLSTQLDSVREETARLETTCSTLTAEKDRLSSLETELTAERDLLRNTLQAFQAQREQLVQTVQQKHQESVSYHAETVRLAKICEELQVNITVFNFIKSNF